MRILVDQGIRVLTYPQPAPIMEYADPSGIYPTFKLELHNRLPLRHLHWNSISRPVRTIDSLHVTLVADKDPVDVKDDGPAPNSESPRKERRHQIPGLRQTPYLKIYLLQCSDVDTYRANSRKLLRDWVKDQTLPSQSSTSLNTQENHDAFEWLIVHVLPVSTDGVTSRPSSVARTESEKKQSSLRWPSRSSSSVIEKIRADFNATSKNVVDRVSQVYVVEPAEEDPGRAQLRSQDENSGWEDFIAKMKSLILASFDLRVNQYGEDIREKELQKNLPGWNFNTFFILKEGLSRGFESVGLTEDALTGYHELAAGLNTLVDGQSGGDTAGQQAALFSDYTEDLNEAFKLAEQCSKMIGTPWQEKPHVVDLGASILNTDRKPFRDLILANRISSFDFQNYVFARQVSLLLRLANVTVHNETPKTGASSEGRSNVQPDVGIQLMQLSSENREDLTVLAEVAERASTFISSVAADLRNDIRSGMHLSDSGQNERDRSSHREDIAENLVASWIFSASERILEVTSASSLSAQLDHFVRQLESSVKLNPQCNEDSVESIVDTVHREGLPNRTSSLKAHASVNSQPPNEESFPSVTSMNAVRLLAPASSHPSTQELASQRGNLLNLARRALSSLGLQHLDRQGGLADLCLVAGAEEVVMQELKLGDTSERQESPESSPVNVQAPTIAGVCNTTLCSAVQSKYHFYQVFEELTLSMLANYVIGGRIKAAEEMTKDLAVTRFLLKDYEMAASYFGQLAPLYRKDDWSDLELLTLELYAHCLHHMKRTKDYISIGMKTLARKIQSKAAIIQQPQNNPIKLTNARQPSQSALVVIGGLSGLLSTSKLLEEQVPFLMDNFFDRIDMGTYVCHSPDDDGFQLPLVLRSLLPERFFAESVRVQILSVGDDQRCELWLYANGQYIEPGMSRIWLRSNMMFPAWYVLNQVNILSGNILFVHSPSSPSDDSPFARSRDSTLSDFTNRRRLLLWPHSRGLEARLVHSENTHLDRSKSIIVKLSSSQNNINQGRLSLRAASAGLRLHTAQAEIRNDRITITDKTKPGTISFGKFHSNITADIYVPYSLESDLKEIIVRIEVSYTTERGEFIHICPAKIPTVIPITINVRDTFKRKSLFSTFTVGTANSMPVRVLKCTVEGNEDYRATSQNIDSRGHDVFVRQPLSLVSRIHRTLQEKRDLGANKILQRKLLLHVEYRCLDREILAIAEKVYLEALAATPFQKLWRLLIPVFLSTLHSRFSNQQLETAGLLRDIDVGTFEDYGWDSAILAGLPSDLGQELATWLRNWHNDHPTISVKDTDRPTPTQHLTVPFDVPQVHILHSVQIFPLHGRSAPFLQQAFLAIGSVLPLKIVISHTRRWWDGDVRSTHDGSLLDFKYEVQAVTDDWTIGGQKKGYFSAKAGESSSFAILLLPQRTGHLMLPSVDIQPVSSPRSLRQADDRRDWAESSTSCETDYQHHSETILVVSDLSSTTVRIDPSSTVGGAWLVESKSR